VGVALREQIHQAAISVSAAGDNTIIAGVAGKVITVVALILSNNVATAQNIIIKDGTGGTALSGAIALPVGSVGGGPAFILPPDPTVDWFQALVAGNSLVLNLSAATAVGGVIWYVQN